MKAKFITFEGCEGAGKTTQIKLLTDYFKNNNIPFILTREPGGAPISEKIRQVILSAENVEMMPETEALLFAAARAQHIREVIRPNLQKGVYVLCDRFIDSSFAYQAYAKGLGFEYINAINERAIDGTMPDATIFLNISPDDAFKRKGGADANDRIEQSGLDFHRKVYEGYLALKNKFSDRFLAIDCSGTAQQTHANIVKSLKDKGLI
jgi:dTMP kinase